MFQQMTPAVARLTFLNFAVFVITLIWPTAVDLLALYPIGSENFKPYQFVSYMFTHGGLMHFLFNMLGLIMFGSLVEMRIGTPKMFAMYVLCGLGAVLVHFGIQYFGTSGLEAAAQLFYQQPNLDNFTAFINNHVVGQGYNPEYIDVMRQLEKPLTSTIGAEQLAAQDQAKKMVEDVLNFQKNGTPVVGASGSIYGILAASAMLFPRMKISLMFLPFGLEARYFIPILMVIELFLANQSFAMDNIAHYAHLGGALTGFIMMIIWQRNNAF